MHMSLRRCENAKEREWWVGHDGEVLSGAKQRGWQRAFCGGNSGLFLDAQARHGFSRAADRIVYHILVSVHVITISPLVSCKSFFGTSNSWSDSCHVEIYITIYNE